MGNGDLSGKWVISEANDLETIEKIASLPPVERREVLSQGNPELRSALQEITTLERNILVLRGILQTLEEDKERLEKAIYRLATKNIKAVEKKAESEVTTLEPINP